MSIVTIIRPTDNTGEDLGIGEDVDLIFHGNKEEAYNFMEEKDGPAFNDQSFHLIEKNMTDIENK